MSEWLKEHGWKPCKHESASWVRIPLSPPVMEWLVVGGDVAQLGERLVRNEEVTGSIPVISTIVTYSGGDRRKGTGGRALASSWLGVDGLFPRNREPRTPPGPEGSSGQ